MTRTILGIATALLAFATLSAPSAQACISCEYTPEVVTKGLKSQPKTYAKKRVVTPSKEIAAARAAKARMAKAAQTSKAVETAKVEDTSKTVASEAKSETESTTIATAPTIESEPAPSAKPAEETTVAQDVGCKKFISAIGTTITVPCE